MSVGVGGWPGGRKSGHRRHPDLSSSSPATPSNGRDPPHTRMGALLFAAHIQGFEVEAAGARA